MTFLHKYLEFATSLMNQDAERVSDRLRHLEECQTWRSFSLVHETPRIEKHFFLFFTDLFVLVEGMLFFSPFFSLEETNCSGFHWTWKRI